MHTSSIRSVVLIGCALTLASAGCADIPGTAAGEPCNPNNVCVKGLRCVAGICQLPGQGVGWRQMDTPRQSTYYAAWARSASEAYAVGSSGVMVRYDGSKWQELSTGSSSTLYAVHGSGSDVWIGGSSGALKRLAGSSIVDTMVFDDTGKELKGVTVRAFAEASGTLYAIGTTSSSSTRVLALGTDYNWRQIGEVSGLSGRCALTIGRDLLIGGTGVSYIARFNLDSKAVVEQLLLPGGKNYAVYALWGKSLTELIAAGDNLALERTGSGWTPMSATTGLTLDGDRDYRAIWGTGISDELIFAGEAKRPGGSYDTEPSGIEGCKQGSCTFDQLLIPDSSGGWTPLTAAKRVHGLAGAGALRLAVGEGGIFKRQ
jgi:hypothetical protein